MSTCFKDTDVIPILLGIGRCVLFCPLVKCIVQWKDCYRTKKKRKEKREKKKRRKKVIESSAWGAYPTCQPTNPYLLLVVLACRVMNPGWNSVAPQVKKACRAARLNNYTKFVSRTPGAVSK